MLLAALAPVTTKLQFGTAMAICHRHPIHLAQSCAGLSEISKGRFILGLGLGGFPHEFAAAGRPSDLLSAPKLARINIEICRRLWRGKNCPTAATYFEFHNVALKPTPKTYSHLDRRQHAGGLPPGGGSWATAGCRRGSITRRSADGSNTCERLRRAGRPMVKPAVMPFTTIGKGCQYALAASTSKVCWTKRIILPPG